MNVTFLASSFKHLAQYQVGGAALPDVSLLQRTSLNIDCVMALFFLLPAVGFCNTRLKLIKSWFVMFGTEPEWVWFPVVSWWPAQYFIGFRSKGSRQKGLDWLWLCPLLTCLCLLSHLSYVARFAQWWWGLSEIWHMKGTAQSSTHGKYSATIVWGVVTGWCMLTMCQVLFQVL